MPESRRFSQERALVETSPEAEQGVLHDIVFEKKAKPGVAPEYRSSAPDRKIMILHESSTKPQPGIPYDVRVLEDTNPDDPTKGKLFVEIVVEKYKAIVETEADVSYLGVKLPKAEHRDSRHVPDRNKYRDFTNDAELALPMQRDIAVAFAAGDPILVEGGTSLGKTTTVRKMAAELGWEVHYINVNGTVDPESLMGRYIPNPNKNKPEDPEYIFADGKITSGLRQEEGRIKVIIIDEINAASSNVLIRLHEVLDALERGTDVVLSEDASEEVPTNKERTKIIALMNPPGKGYLERQPLDPAQLRRWVYNKAPSELPASTFAEATSALFGGEVKTANVAPEAFLPYRDQALSVEQVGEIPGIEGILKKFQEFHTAAKALVKSRQVAADQPQPFTFDDRMEPRRVRDFILRFYRGDLNEAMQQALRYYYANKLETKADRKKLEELIKLVEYTPKSGETKRRGLDRKKGEGKETEKKSLVFAVRNAKNPFAEPLKLAGVPDTDPDTAEIKDTMVDIEEVVERAMYRYKNLGLAEWADDIERDKEALFHSVSLDAERQKIIERIKAGMTPIVMPGREIQKTTWRQALNKLRPVVVKNGEMQRGIGAAFDETFVNVMKNGDLFTGIPTNPYIVWVHPTQRPLPESEDKDVSAQQLLLQSLQRDYPQLYDKTDIIPTEYAALQHLWTNEVYDIASGKGGRASGVQVQTVLPLDFHTSTRFVSASLASGQGLTSLYPEGGDYLGFLTVHADVDPDVGFRPVSRT